MPQGVTNQPGQMDDGAFSKASATVMQGLAEMYKACYKRDPGSDLPAAVQDLQTQVADLEAQYEGVPGPATPTPGDPEAAAAEGLPMEVPPEEQAMMDSEAAGPPPADMNDAGAQMEAMLQMANRRRPPR